MIETKLGKYWGKTVKVTYHDDDVVIGFVCAIETEFDSEEGVESITLRNTGRGNLYEIAEPDIKEIVILE